MQSGQPSAEHEKRLRGVAYGMQLWVLLYRRSVLRSKRPMVSKSPDTGAEPRNSAASESDRVPVKAITIQALVVEAAVDANLQQLET